jgi:NAD(P)-dependent dehydrogenase (short-subunit alcohol dehydrogenase family)
MFKDKVAVVTGAASGIGKSLAQKAAAEGMQLVLADIALPQLTLLQEELCTQTACVIVPMDVTQKEDWQKLLNISLKNFNRIDLFFNNAAIGGPVAKTWTLAPERLQQLLDVNLFGALHGIQTMVPQLLKQDSESHIVITAAMSGFFTYPYFAPYELSKHAVIALAECLYHELREIESPINISVLCPGFVQTQIFNKALQMQMDDVTDMDLLKPIKDLYKRVKYGMESHEIANITFTALQEKKFYIMTHPEMKEFAQARFEAILKGDIPVKFDIS